MTDLELIEKAKQDDGLTVEEVKRYQTIVPLQKHVYGKYGTLAKKYLEEHNIAKYWALTGNLPDYLHHVDRQAEAMYDALYKKLSVSPVYQRTGNYTTDVQRLNALHQVIEETILNEIVYV